MSILVILDHAHGALSTGSLSTITAAEKLAAICKSDVHAVIIGGKSLDNLSNQISQLPCVKKIFILQAEHLEHSVAEDITPALVELAKDYRHVMASANTFGKNLMPRIAATLDVAQISDITAVLKENVFERPIYAGNAIATVESNDKTICLTVRSTAFEPTALKGGSATTSNLPTPTTIGKVKFIKLEETRSERPELTSAKIVVSGGRGMAAKENFALLEKLAAVLNAAVGASRAAVDAGYAPNDYQVGQTGKVVAPELYIAVGISGAIQHLAGMKDSKVIVAINKDEEAPIFQIADYGLVCDLFQAIPELTKELSK